MISLDEGIVEGDKAADRAEVREEEKSSAPQHEAPETTGKAEAVKAPEPEEKLIQIETRKAPEAAPEAPTPEAVPESAPATAPEAPAEAVAPQAEAPAAAEEEPQAEHPALAGSIADGLEENLRSAGLVQVHTAKPSAATGYEPVVQPGRVIEHAAAEAEEGPLTQVHTKPELCRPVDYAPVIQPGRKVESSAEAAPGEALVQVETKKN